MFISQGCNDRGAGKSSQRIAEGDEAFLVDIGDDAEHQIGGFYRLDFLLRLLCDGFDCQRFVP